MFDFTPPGYSSTETAAVALRACSDSNYAVIGPAFIEALVAKGLIKVQQAFDRLYPPALAHVETFLGVSPRQRKTWAMTMFGTTFGDRHREIIRTLQVLGRLKTEPNRAVIKPPLALSHEGRVYCIMLDHEPRLSPRIVLPASHVTYALRADGRTRQLLSR